MYPIHKEKYYLTGETFHSFMRDRLAKDLKKEQNGYKLMAAAMFIVGVVIVGIILFSGGNDVKSDLVWTVLPIVFVFLGISNINKYRQAEKGLDKKIISDYTNQQFEKHQLSVKFYEDKLEYTKGETKEEYDYNGFKKFYEGEKYFAIYFNSGDIIIFNPNCKVDKIKEIINNYVSGVKAAQQ